MILFLTYPVETMDPLHDNNEQTEHVFIAIFLTQKIQRGVILIHLSVKGGSDAIF